MTRLQELLSETPTDEELERSIELATYPDGERHWRIARDRVDTRLALVRETMRECAKMVCWRCAEGWIPTHYLPGVGINDKGHPRETWGEDEPVWVHTSDPNIHLPGCDAGEINALLSESEASK